MFSFGRLESTSEARRRSQASRWIAGIAAFALSSVGLAAVADPASATPPLAKTISISNIPTVNGVVGQTFTPTFSGTYTGIASVSSSTTSVCTVASGVVSFVAAGTCTLTASSTDPLTGSAQSFNVGTQKVFDGPNGEVDAIAQDADGNTYIGGQFDGVQAQSGGNAQLSDASSSTVAVDRTFPKMNGTIYASVPDGSGGWYIGGNFTTVDGLERMRAAHILANGSVDPAWNPRFNSAVKAMVKVGSTIYFGGEFGAVGAKYATTATTGIASGTTLTLTKYDSSIQVGDAVWGPYGYAVATTVSSIGTCTDGASCDITLSTATTQTIGTTTGPVYFGSVRKYLAAMGTDGTLLSWNPSANNAVYALAVSGSTVYVGGAFTSVGPTRTETATGQTATTTVTLTSPDSTIAPYDTVTGNGVVASTVVSAVSTTNGVTTVTLSKALAANVTTAGPLTFTNVRKELAAIGTDGTIGALSQNFGGGQVNALAVSGSSLYVGGSFSSIVVGTGTCSYVKTTSTVTVSVLATGTKPAAGLVITSTGSGIPANTAIIAGTNSYTPATNLTISATNNAAVNQSSKNCAWAYPRAYLLSVSTTDGSLTSFNPAMESVVSALAVYPVNGADYIAAGGAFTKTGSTTRLHAASWLASDNSLSSWNPSVNGNVFSLAVSGSNIYIGGQFTQVGSTVRNKLAVVDTSGTLNSTWDPNANADVNHVNASGSSVLAGGSFSTIGPKTTRNRLAKFDANDALTSWDPNANGTVYSLAVTGSTVYVGGSFTTIGSSAHTYAAAIGTDGTLSTTFDPNVNNTVYAVATDGTTVYLGGTFTTVGGGTTARNRLASYLVADGSLTSWDANASSEVDALTIANSKIYAAGQFTQVAGGTQLRSHWAAWNTSDGSLSSITSSTDNGLLALASDSNGVVYTGGYNTAAQKSCYALGTDGTQQSWITNSCTGAGSPLEASMAVNGSTVYVGGQFTVPGIRLVATPIVGATGAGTFTDWRPAPQSGKVTALLATRSSVYAGGTFTSTNYTDGQVAGMVKLSKKSNVALYPSPYAKTISVGSAIPSIGYSAFIGNAGAGAIGVTSSSDWTTEPSCGVYAQNDQTYSTALTGSSVAAGTYNIHCTSGSSANYRAANVADGVLTITKISTTVTASSPASVDLNTAVPSVSYTTSPATASSDWTAQPTCAVYASSDTTYATPLTGAQAVGTYVTHCSGGTSATYNPTSYVNGSLTVTKPSLSVTASSPSAIDSATALPAVTYTTSPSTTSSDWTAEPTCAVYASTDSTFATALTGAQAAGTYVTHCSGGSSASYTPSSYVDGSLTVTQYVVPKTNVVVNASSPSSVNSNTAVPSVGYTTSPSTVAGDWTVQPTCAVYASSDTGYATALSGAAVAAGTYVTHCSGGSSASYNPTSYVNGSLTVTPATTNVTVTAATSSITYGASMPSAGYTTSPSTVAGDWTSEPSCAVYSTSDTGFASPLSGQHSAGTYVTHCAGGTSTSYTPTSYVDGVLTIDKAASSTVLTCPTVHVTYTGSAQTPCSAAVTGAGGLSTTASVTYASNNDAGTAIANASYAGDTNHNSSSAAQSSFVIDQAASTTTVTCSPKTTTYSGSAQTLCSAAVTGAGGLNLTDLTPSYTSNTSAGTSTAAYSFVGDANHASSQGSDTFSIDPATVVVTADSPSLTYGDSIPSITYSTSPTTVAGDWTTEPSCSVYSTSDTTFASPLSGVHSAGTYVTHCSNGSSSNYTTTVVVDGSLTIYKAASTTVITCPASVTYSGSYQEPCTAAVSGVGDLSTTATVTYANNRDAGTGLADSTYAGDANHMGSDATQSSFAIDKASTSTVITCPTAHEIFDGNEHYPCTAAVTGAGLTTTTSVIYASNFDAGNATADASYDGDNNYLSSTATQSGFVIDKTTSTTAVTCSLPSVTYNGSAQTPCTATVVGAGGLGQSIDVLYSPNTDAGSVSATANYVGDPNHYGSSDQSGFTIVPATSTTTVTCSVSSTPYNGSEQTPCTAQVTGDGGLSQSLDVQYSPNTDAGSVLASANYPGDPNHDNSSDSSGFAIDAVTSTTTVTCSVSSVTYDGSIQTPCSASVSGAGGLSQPLDVQYSPNTDAGSVSASADYPGDPNHYGSSDQSGFMIDQAPSATTVSCSVLSVMYDGSIQTPCSASVSGAGGLSQPLDVQYSPNTDAGSVSASASFQGDPNHSPSSDLSGFGIEQASSSTVITCPIVHSTFDGTAQAPCSAAVTGPGGLATTATVVYANNTNAGTATADASYAGDGNHTPSAAEQSSFVIDRASSSTTVTCSPKSTTYSGIAQALCSASVTGAGGLNLTGLTPSYLANTNAGTATASYVFAGDPNHTGSDGSDTFSINPATVVVTSSSPTITYGAVVPAISYATSPVTVAGDWTTEPVCGVYASADTSFASALTGVLGAGSYVTHCSNGVSSNYTTISSVDGTLTVDKADTTTVVTCSSSSVTYDGSAQTPCSAAVTGAGGLSTTVPVSYLANTNAGTATADATYVGDANHTGSTATQVSFTIAKAVSSTVIMCAASYTYTGSAIENCAAAVTGVGGLSTSVTPTYSTDHTNVGSVTVNASYAGDANHTGSSATQVSFAITKAASSTVITCSASSFVYTGSAQTPCGSAVVTGAGGLSTTATVVYASNTNVGTATANASYAGDANHTGSTATQQTFAITKASVVVNAPIVNITYNTAIPPVGFSTTPATVMADWTSVPTCAVYAPLGVVAVTGIQPAGTYETRCSGGVSANYAISSYVKGSLAIAQAPTVTTITCTTPTYTGVALTPCTATVTGSGLTTITGVPTYTNNINAGVNTASATYSYAGTANYLPSTATVNFTINKATSTVTVTCSVTTAVYTGVAITPCGTTAAVTGVGGLSTTTPIVYTNNLTVTTADKLATATGTYAGDANHATATASKTYTITKAPATATITCTGTTFVYTAAAITPCSASVTSVGVAVTATPTYTANTNVGTATAAYTYAGDTNHASVVATAKTFTITKANSVTTVTCPTTTSTYTGAAITPCTATRTGPGLTGTVTPTYVNNTNPGTATASYAYAGTTNVNASSASATFTIVAITPTIVYTGTQIANSTSTSTLTLSSTTSSTLCTGALTYSLDRNPTTGAAGAFLLSASPVNTFGWLDGVYVITSARAASTGCTAVSDNQSVVTIANTTSRAYGGGKYTVTGQPAVSVGWFITAGTTTPATGQFQFIENNTWKYIGNLTTYTKTGTTGVSTGTGTLSYWNTTTKTWVSVGSAIPVSITYTNGANGTLATTFTYTPKTGEPALPTTAAQKIGTTIKVG
jgi:hypothetical protein